MVTKKIPKFFRDASRVCGSFLKSFKESFFQLQLNFCGCFFLGKQNTSDYEFSQEQGSNNLEYMTLRSLLACKKWRQYFRNTIGNLDSLLSG